MFIIYLGVVEIQYVLMDILETARFGGVSIPLLINEHNVESVVVSRNVNVSKTHVDAVCYISSSLVLNTFRKHSYNIKWQKLIKS